MADGRIKIAIEVDGKEVNVAAKELDKLEDAGVRSGKGIKSAESSMDSLSDKSAKAGSSVKGAGDAIEGLGESGSRAGKDLKGADSAIDGLSDSSSEAASSVKGVKDAVDGLGDSGSKAGKDLKGADSVIDGLADSSSEAAKSVKGTSDSLEGMAGKAEEAAGSAKKMKDETDGIGQQTSKATISIKNLAVSLGLVAIASAAFDTLKSSLDSAIARFDTLNAFPKVLQALGVSAEDSQRAMDKLSEGIEGLPTTLDDIAGSAQRMYTSFGDMDKATDTAIALNNALLGSGSSAEEAKRGADQYIKALQSGKIQMDTWNTLSETMDVGLIKVAESLGFAGKSAKDDLYRALQDGTVTLDQFNDKLIELGTGTGIMAQLAKENSLGIATSISNLKNAAARGVANIIDSFNKLSKETTGKDIAQNIDSLKAVVNSSFKVIGSVIEGATPIVKVFASTVQGAIPVVKALSPAIIGLMTAYAAYTVISKASAAIAASNKVLAIAQASQKALALATKSQIAAQAASTTATAADTVAKAAQTGTISLSTLAIGVMTGTVKASTAAQIIGTTASYAFGAAIKFLMGPVGWVTAGIGLLVTGVIALVKWFNKSTEEGERLGKQTEKLASATDTLNSAVDESSRTYENNQQKIETNAQAYTELVAQIEELAAKEKKSAEEKKLLNSYIEELNRNVDGLNLVYGEQSDALSMTSEQMLNRINLMKEEAQLQSSQERLTEIMKEQVEIGKQQKEITALRKEWNQKLEDGSVKGREHKKALEELEEQELSLAESNKAAGEERLRVEQQIVESSKAVADATQNDVGRQKLLFDELSEAQQQTVESMKSSWEDYRDAATDMFDTISTKSELSVAEMTANLEKNQETITSWSENIAKLAERGVDEGLLETLRAAGPESAGHVNALVNASDSELQKLSDAFAKGGDVATDALSTSLGIEQSGVMEAVGHLVTGTENSLKEQINSADFKSIGSAVPEGFAVGVNSGSENVKGASKKMADDTTAAAKNALAVNSPSRVFKAIGVNVAEGLAIGIDQGTSKVVQAVQKMFRSVETNSTSSFKAITTGYESAVKQIEATLAKLPQVTQKSMQNMTTRLDSGAKAQLNTMKDLSRKYDQSVKQIDISLNKLTKVANKAMTSMQQTLKRGGSAQMATMRSLASAMPTPYNSLPGRMKTIGLHAMSGLNAGLNAGSGRVMATARSIANRVASTMKQALKIHSPSRLMRDDVGRWIPEGIAVGIKENAKSVYLALDDLSDGMMLSSTPEVALGTSKMVYSSGGGSSASGSNSHVKPTKNNSDEITIVVEPSEIIMDGYKVGEVVWKPVKEKIDRNESRKRRTPKVRGRLRDL